jgi:N-acetylglucosamine repressor
MSHPLPVGSFQGMKSQNKSTILNVIRLQGPISRAEIAKLTRLTPPTVTNIVSELLESRLVMESEHGESTGGRKPIMLRINSAAYHVIGVYAGSLKVKAVAAQLDGKIVHQTELAIPSSPTKEQFLQVLLQAVRLGLEGSGRTREEILGIGVGMHGLVDPTRGISIFAPNLNLYDIDIKGVLESEFGLSVEVDNDVRALALGESWFGQGQGIAKFVCVNVGTGVGTGILIDHKLYHGATFTAGELGHTTIDVNGPRCSCGNYGCLEALTGGPAIARRALQGIRIGKRSLLEEWTDGDLEEITSEMVHRAAAQGDSLAVEVLNDTGRYLGIGISNLINTLNPSRIILSGGVSRAGEFILKPLQDVVEMRALKPSASSVSIVVSELGPNANAIGAVTLLLDKLFTPSGVEGV